MADFLKGRTGGIAALVVFLTAAVWLAWRAPFWVTTGSHEPDIPLPGQPAPEFSLPGLLPTGEAISAGRLTLAQTRGKTVFIDFWASWCRPCDYELPVLNRFYLNRREQGVEVIAISVDTNRAAAVRYAGSKHLAMPTGWDPEGRVAGLYRVEILPTLIVIAPDGRVREVEQGLRDDLEAWLEAQVRAGKETP